MYEVIVDSIESMDQEGASFCFRTLTEMVSFLEICFNENNRKDSVLIREVKE